MIGVVIFHFIGEIYFMINFFRRSFLSFVISTEYAKEFVKYSHPSAPSSRKAGQAHLD